MSSVMSSSLAMAVMPTAVPSAELSLILSSVASWSWGVLTLDSLVSSVRLMAIVSVEVELSSLVARMLILWLMLVS